MTQNEKVLAYVKEFGSISPLEAFRDLAIMRLGARIYDLEQKGHFFDRKVEKAKNRFGDSVHYVRYSLKE